MSGSNIHYWSYIREPKRGYHRNFTQLFANAEVFQHAIKDLAEPFKDKGVNKVVALDALGFTLGGGVAYVLGAGLVHIRKEGKISWDVETQAFRDHSGMNQVFEIANDAIQAGDNVLVVDDWPVSGERLKAAFLLIERLQARVVGAALLNMAGPAWHDSVLIEYRHEIHCLVDYE